MLRSKVEPSIPFPSKILLTRKLFKIIIFINSVRFGKLLEITKTTTTKRKISLPKICIISIFLKENILVLPNERF